MTLGEKLKEIRTAAKLSLRFVGNMANVGYSQLSLVEKGYDPKTHNAPTMTIDSLSRVCAVLRYDLPLLLEETGYIPPRPADEVELIKAYRSLTEENKKVALNQVKSLVTR